MLPVHRARFIAVHVAAITSECNQIGFQRNAPSGRGSEERDGCTGILSSGPHNPRTSYRMSA
jgi:hypothetical protein